jgi:hypothetical protein
MLAQHAAAAMALEKTQFKHPTPKVKNTKNGNTVQLSPSNTNVRINHLLFSHLERVSILF